MTELSSLLSEIEAQVRGAGRVLVATDFDGTLCPIARVPSEVRLDAAAMEILRSAETCPRLSMAVISGRSLQDVKRMAPFNFIFAGNHGLEIAGGGLNFEHQDARRLRGTISSACMALTALQREWPNAWVEDKDLSATLHYRQVQECHHYSLLFEARRLLRAFSPNLALRVGKRALEVRPRIGWDKGNALRYIWEKAGPFQTCIAIGDDRTDESMFCANRGRVNIRVGASKTSEASHFLSDPDEVAILLFHIVDLCGSAAPKSRSVGASSVQMISAAQAISAGDLSS